MAACLVLLIVQASLKLCSAVRRWRRPIAALLGRFLPKLRAAGDSGPLLRCLLVAVPVSALQVDHPE
jgi:hypothetical protein